MRRCKNMLILPVPFDLCRSCIPIRESIDGLCWSPQIPAMHIAVDCAGREEIWMVGREVYIGNSSRMGMESMFDRRPRAVMVEVPHQSLLVRGTDHPMVPGSERRPLHVCWGPLLLVCEVSRRGIGRVEVDNVQSFGAGEVSSCDAAVVGLPTMPGLHLCH